MNTRRLTTTHLDYDGDGHVIKVRTKQYLLGSPLTELTIDSGNHATRILLNKEDLHNLVVGLSRSLMYLNQ